MALRGIRSTVQRFVVVAGLAGALLVGSVALGPQSDASAAPIHCALAEWAYAIGNVYFNAGDYTAAAYHYGRGSVYQGFC